MIYRKFLPKELFRLIQIVAREWEERQNIWKRKKGFSKFTLKPFVGPVLEIYL